MRKIVDEFEFASTGSDGRKDRDRLIVWWRVDDKFSNSGNFIVAGSGPRIGLLPAAQFSG